MTGQTIDVADRDRETTAKRPSNPPRQLRLHCYVAIKREGTST
jgi:hypothetical protein